MGPAKRDALARKLVGHAKLTAAVIARRGESMTALQAIIAARTMSDLAQQTLQHLVDEARASGHTWQQIGDVLGTTRQAAFQRFGGA
jgi:hypothetical protein